MRERLVARRPLLLVALVATLAWMPAASAEAPTSVVPQAVDTLVLVACAALDAVRDQNWDEEIVWHIHADPMECSPDAYVFYVKVGVMLQADFMTGHFVVASRDVQDDRPYSKERLVDPWYACVILRSAFGRALDDSKEGYEASLLQLEALARRVEELGALAPGDTIVVPAVPPRPEADAPDAGPPPDAVQIEATAGPATDSVAVDSRGEGTPAPSAAPGIPAYRFETASSAGPTRVDASVDPEPIAGLLASHAGTEPPAGRAPPRLSLAGELRPHPLPLARVEAPARTTAPAEAPGPASDPQREDAPRAPAPDVRLAGHVAAHAPASFALGAIVAGSAACAIALALAALYHRLTGQKLRSSGPRAAVLDLLGREPGLLATEIADRLKLHRTTAEYHLKLLRSAGAVTTRPVFRRAAYFLPGFLCAPEPRSPAARAILGLARASPGATLGDAAAAAGVGLPSASRHARRLQTARLLDVRRDGRYCRLYPAG